MRREELLHRGPKGRRRVRKRRREWRRQGRVCGDDGRGCVAAAVIPASVAVYLWLLLLLLELLLLFDCRASDGLWKGERRCQWRRGGYGGRRIVVRMAVVGAILA